MAIYVRRTGIVIIAILLVSHFVASTAAISANVAAVAFARWQVAQDSASPASLPERCSLPGSSVNGSGARIAAHCFELSGEFDRAIEVLENVPESYQPELVAWDLVRYYAFTGQRDKAAARLAKLGLTVDGLVRLGAQARQQGNTETFHILLEEASAKPKTTGNWVSRRTLGLWLMGEENWALARTYLEQVAAEVPSDLYTLYLLGLVYRHQNELDLSVATWQRALDLSPDNSTYMRELALTLIIRNHADDRNVAVELLNRVITVHPQDDLARKLLIELGDSGE